MLPGRIRARGLSSASNEIWHSEKIRFACKFSLRSVHEGFAGFGAGCSLLPRAAPGSRPCFGCARPSAPELAPLLPKITPQAWGSESWGCHLPVEGKRRSGWTTGNVIGYRLCPGQSREGTGAKRWPWCVPWRGQCMEGAMQS